MTKLKEQATCRDKFITELQTRSAQFEKSATEEKEVSATKLRLVQGQLDKLSGEFVDAHGNITKSDLLGMVKG